MPDAESRHPVPVLELFVAGLFAAMGSTPPEAAILTEQILHAALRGHPGQGQGLEKLPRVYERLRGGTIVPGAALEVVGEAGAWVHLDAHKGWGPVAAARAMDMAAERAQALGIGIAVVRHSNHLGTCGYHAERAARRGLIGICMTNAGPEMAPWGGITPLLGTNPWGIAVPRARFPLLLDMALTQSGKGMVRWYQKEGRSIPKNWAYAPDGSETDDPELALKGPLVPIGEFKGTGLSLMTDILCGVMSGAAFGSRPYSDPGNHDVGHVLVAIDPTRFMPPDAFAQRLEALCAEIKSSEKKAGVEEIFLPGEIEYRRYTDRVRNGLPIPADTLSGLRSLAARLGVPCPL